MWKEEKEKFYNFEKFYFLYTPSIITQRNVAFNLLILLRFIKIMLYKFDYKSLESVDIGIEKKVKLFGVRLS